MPVGLIVREPFASMIVDGEKRWEIRTKKTRRRGKIYIISNGKIIGKAYLVDVKGPFKPSELKKYYKFHRVDQKILEKYSAGRKLYAWIFDKTERLEKPIKIKIPKGAIVWVKLNNVPID